MRLSNFEIIPLTMESFNGETDTIGPTYNPPGPDGSETIIITPVYDEGSYTAHYCVLLPEPAPWITGVPGYWHAQGVFRSGGEDKNGSFEDRFTKSNVMIIREDKNI